MSAQDAADNLAILAAQVDDAVTPAVVTAELRLARVRGWQVRVADMLARLDLTEDEQGELADDWFRLDAIGRQIEGFLA